MMNDQVGLNSTIDWRILEIEKSLPGIPCDITNIILGYSADGYPDGFPNIEEQCSLLCVIARLFLSIITFGIWDQIQTTRFWDAVEIEESSKKLSERAAALRTMESALRWGADLSPAGQRCDFFKLAASNDETLLRFFAAQICKESGEEDVILQQFCYSIKYLYHSERHDNERDIQNAQKKKTRLMEIVKPHVQHSSDFGSYEIKNRRYTYYNRFDSDPFKYAVNAFKNRNHF